MAPTHSPFRPKRLLVVAAHRWRRAAPALAFFCAISMLYLFGLFSGVDDAISLFRSRVLPSEASHSLTVVEIDGASIRAAGQWPWNRERFATAIENLRAAGARVIAFDVDFSTRSNDAEDGALTQSIGQGRDIVLPTFLQPSAGAGRSGSLVETSPLTALAAHARLASINVDVDGDGRIRSYRYGFAGPNGYRQTMAAMLAGVPAGAKGSFLIDYGLNLQNIDHLSFEDVYSGHFDAGLVRGRAILIGPTALELGDEVATPRYPIVPGVYIHALAYENMVSGQMLRPAGIAGTLVLFFLAIVWMFSAKRLVSVPLLLLRHGLLAVAALSISLLLQALFNLVFDLSPFLLAQACFVLLTVRDELRRRADELVQQREAALIHLSLHDSESGLPNRRLLARDLSVYLQADDGRKCAVVTVGIDRFSFMRGAIGYGRFNTLVQKVAARLSELNEGRTAAHLSTSVLGLILPVETLEEARVWCMRAAVALENSFEVEGHAVDTFPRFGVAFRAAHESADLLLERASIALDLARNEKRELLVFDPDAYGDPTVNLALMSELVKGISAGQFSVHYQPKRTLATGQIDGAEALVRWAHPKRGLVSPVDFIETAEETGTIRMLTEWVLEQVIQDHDRLRRMGHDLLLSVNISARLLTDKLFLEFAFERVLHSSAELCFEITETAVIENPALAMATIAEMRMVGIKISIDDYGSGLSSVSYLKQIHADELKLDKSLVVSLGTGERDRLVVKSTVDLAHNLGMIVVAEGIEDAETLVAAKAAGCDVGQGYWISRPVGLSEFIEALASSKVRPPLTA